MDKDQVDLTALGPALKLKCPACGFRLDIGLNIRVRWDIFKERWTAFARCSNCNYDMTETLKRENIVSGKLWREQWGPANMKPKFKDWHGE